MTPKIRIGISACLLGAQVRYDGGHKLDPFLRETLGPFVRWVPVCPEVEAGLPVPREALWLVGTKKSYRLCTISTGIDHTERMLSWARRRFSDLERLGLCGFVFKSRSPSSGMGGVTIYSDAGMPVATGAGIFARAFMERFPLLPVEDEARLRDPRLRENFIRQVFVCRRWKDFLAGGASPSGLAAFHRDHKFLIMAHSQKHLRILGALVAGGGGRAVREEYFRTLMEALALEATVRKNVKVLHHISGYFMKQLAAGEKKELREVIGQYNRGLVPLIVPLVLMGHYAKKYDDPYLRTQVYLAPHPAELMLRNHV
ncbi:MAG: hypothetical protein A2X56_02600 [Nitrospirae bacterium GWC2_57_13]|nr:MAG: hypothetical protein A2072_05125 [Nitrospirae bacterium GWC1_57_7]OGW28589.1 MAG: hypothetical protein A2X56_02600 [Nitrospirae bacterium GWC2_57_13]OGW42247.1 MAG: hypothetical protein A2X57_08950 [Nitrospirae bacterium GWD2_57_8]